MFAFSHKIGQNVVRKTHETTYITNTRMNRSLYRRPIGGYVWRADNDRCLGPHTHYRW